VLQGSTSYHFKEVYTSFIFV